MTKMNIFEKIALIYAQGVLDDIYTQLKSKKSEIIITLDQFGPRRHTDNNFQKEAQ
jgi:hypothetical protein